MFLPAVKRLVVIISLIKPICDFLLVIENCFEKLYIVSLRSAKLLYIVSDRCIVILYCMFLI